MSWRLGSQHVASLHSLGKWCLGDWAPNMLEKHDVRNLDPKSAMPGMSEETGQARYRTPDREYPLSTVCIRRLPHDFCKFTRHPDALPGSWAHAFVRTKYKWWEGPPEDSQPPVSHDAPSPYSHGQMITEKAQIYSGSIDPNFPESTKPIDNQQITQSEKVEMDSEL